MLAQYGGYRLDSGERRENLRAVIVVYTDGACSGNPGPGGWAWAVTSTSPVAPGAQGSGSERMTTNQRMEINAALDALQTLGPVTDGPIEVVSDSTYVVNCFRDRWWEGWIARGWKNAAKKPVANRDLWEPLVGIVRARSKTDGAVRFRWVKGHGGDRMNDLVDRLAVEAAAQRRPRAVTGLALTKPAGPRAADIPETGAAAETRSGAAEAAPLRLFD